MSGLFVGILCCLNNLSSMHDLEFYICYLLLNVTWKDICQLQHKCRVHWKQGFVRWYVKKWTFSIFSTFHDSGVSMSSTYCFFPVMRTALGNSWLSWPFLHPLLSHLAQRATYAWAVHMHSEGSWMWAGLDLPTHCFFLLGMSVLRDERGN